jgi:alginate O-acetyltransferase complex protein AlgI
MENFSWPFLQPNIAGFWRCWHISLTSWSRDYIYMPLIGAYRNPYLASLSAFAFIGLWHDISLPYLSWGLYNALGVIGWQNWQSIKRKYGLTAKSAFVPSGIRKAASILLTVHFFMGSFILVT